MTDSIAIGGKECSNYTKNETANGNSDNVVAPAGL